MDQVSAWDIALVAAAALLAVAWLVRLMRAQRQAVIEELREQAARERRAGEPSESS